LLDLALGEALGDFLGVEDCLGELYSLELSLEAPLRVLVLGYQVEELLYFLPGDLVENLAAGEA
jgi:hypothetical protein